MMGRPWRYLRLTPILARQHWQHLKVLDWFGLTFNVPGKQFFSHVWTEPPLPGYYQYFFFFFFFFLGGGGGGGKYVLLKDITRRPEWG